MSATTKVPLWLWIALAVVLLAGGGTAAVYMTRAIRNNNPLNLRANKFVGFKGLDADGYAIFDTMANGLRGAARQLLLYQSRGIVTPTQIVSTWAPSNENDTQAYIDYMCSELGINQDVPVNLSDRNVLFDWMRAQIRQEAGSVPALTISDAQVNAAIDAARASM